jgi:hypothetical protein
MWFNRLQHFCNDFCIACYFLSKDMCLINCHLLHFWLFRVCILWILVTCSRLREFNNIFTWHIFDSKEFWWSYSGRIQNFQPNDLLIKYSILDTNIHLSSRKRKTLLKREINMSLLQYGNKSIFFSLPILSTIDTIYA